MQSFKLCDIIKYNKNKEVIFNMNDNGFLTVKDLSEIFGISVQAVYDWINDKRLKTYQISSRKRIRPEDLLQYLKDRGNSDYTMKEFKHDIEFYLMEKALGEAKTPEEVKALQEKDPKMFGDVMMNSKSHLPGSIVGFGNYKSPYGSIQDQIKVLEESKEAEKYINEAETPEEKAKRFAEVKNYKEGKCDKPWGKQ